MWRRKIACFVGLCGMLAVTSTSVADDVLTKEQESPLSILTSSELHEAFVAPEDHFSDPPVTVPQAPPAELVEVKPAIVSELEKRAIWIPGYWKWVPDSERFIWVTGVWRFPPPGHRWHTGMWVQTDDGFVRSPGRWVPQAQSKLIYVEKPPRYKEAFPLVRDIPDAHYWVPGCWQPVAHGKYKWKDGYFSPLIDKWVWVPAQYSWTPQGWLWGDGYWDFPLDGRGQAFASLRVEDRTYDARRIRVETFVPVPSSAIREAELGTYVYFLDAIPEALEWVSLSGAHHAVPDVPTVSDDVHGASDRPLATVQGIVRKGPLTPPRIEVELIGHESEIAVTDEEGRFEFTNVPFGIYLIRAAGPVQNHVRRASIRLQIAEPVVEAELNLH